MKLTRTGTSLINIMVASVIGSILALSAQKMFDVNLKATRTVTALNQVNSIRSNLDLLLSNPAQCASNLWNGRVTPGRARFLPRSNPPPGSSIVEVDRLKRIGTQGNYFLKIGDSVEGVRISQIDLDEVSRDTSNPLMYQYVAKLQISFETPRTLATSAKKYVALLQVKTDRDPTNTIADNTIIACSSINPPSTASLGGDYQILHGPVTLTRAYAPTGCDPTPSAGAPAGMTECYCGGLETIHRRTATNPDGNPYLHGTQSPRNFQRPRFWIGTLACPAGYVAFSATSNCGNIAGSGKMENIERVDDSTMRVSCCVYTSDALAAAIPAPTYADGMSILCRSQ